jgi:hypothetical protein
MPSQQPPAKRYPARPPPNSYRSVPPLRFIRICTSSAPFCSLRCCPSVVHCPTRRRKARSWTSLPPAPAQVSPHSIRFCWTYGSRGKIGRRMGRRLSCGFWWTGKLRSTPPMSHREQRFELCCRSWRPAITASPSMPFAARWTWRMSSLPPPPFGYLSIGVRAPLPPSRTMLL